MWLSLDFIPHLGKQRKGLFWGAGVGLNLTPSGGSPAPPTLQLPAVPWFLAPWFPCGPFFGCPQRALQENHHSRTRGLPHLQGASGETKTGVLTGPIQPGAPGALAAAGSTLGPSLPKQTHSTPPTDFQLPRIAPPCRSCWAWDPSPQIRTSVPRRSPPGSALAHPVPLGVAKENSSWSFWSPSLALKKGPHTAGLAPCSPLPHRGWGFQEGQRAAAHLGELSSEAALAPCQTEPGKERKGEGGGAGGPPIAQFAYWWGGQQQGSLSGPRRPKALSPQQAQRLA